jgi:hypothetical protein
MKAHFIKHVPTLGTRGYDCKALYRLSPPLNDEGGNPQEYVVVSAVGNSMIHETYIFPANPRGDIISFLEMKGSDRDTTNHEQVLNNAGYEVVFPPLATTKG